MSEPKPVFELQEGWDSIVNRAQKELRKQRLPEDVVRSFTNEALEHIDDYEHLELVLKKYFEVIE